VSRVVAYKLDLPDTMRVHPVFHVSLLKPYHASGNVQPPPLPDIVDGEAWYHVEKILQHRDVQVITRRATKHQPKRSTLQREYLIKWEGYSDDHNSWEPAEGVSESAKVANHAYREIPLP